MKKLIISLSAVILFLILCLHVFADYPISWSTTAISEDDISKVELNNIKKILVKEAPSDYFPSDIELTKIGTLRNKEASFHILLSKLEWGNRRLTTRLVILSNKWHYLGNYYLNDDPIGVRENGVLFPFDELDGNLIKFENKKPPKQVYLDGELVDFDTALNSKISDN